MLISLLPGGFVDPGTIGFYRNFVNNNGGPNSTLMVSGPINLAQVVARGIELNGHQSLIAGFSFDYDYAVESTLLRSADINGSPDICRRSATRQPNNSDSRSSNHRHVLASHEVAAAACAFAV